MDEPQRDHTLNIRCTSRELEAWSGAASDSPFFRSRSSWIRDVLNRSARAQHKRSELEAAAAEEDAS